MAEGKAFGFGRIGKQKTAERKRLIAESGETKVVVSAVEGSVVAEAKGAVAASQRINEIRRLLQAREKLISQREKLSHENKKLRAENKQLTDEIVELEDEINELISYFETHEFLVEDFNNQLSTMKVQWAKSSSDIDATLDRINTHMKVSA